MQAHTKILLVFLLFMALFMASPNLARAQATTSDCGAWHLGCPLIPLECTDNQPDGLKPHEICDVNDIVTTAIHLAQWILAVIGAVAFGYFVYGGFVWLTAAGNSNQVDHGRRILVGTVIGLIIVLGAFQLVRWVGTLFGGGSLPQGYEQFLDTEGATQCINVGDACVRAGQSVYVCSAPGVCSNESLCAYRARTNTGGLDSSYACRDESQNECIRSSIKPGLCPGEDNIVCCQAP